MFDVDALVAAHEHEGDRCRRCFEEGREAAIREVERDKGRALARHHRQMHRTLATCEACRALGAVPEGELALLSDEGSGKP